jgi:hypothetical protein
VISDFGFRIFGFSDLRPARLNKFTVLSKKTLGQAGLGFGPPAGGWILDFLHFALYILHFAFFIILGSP